jgi:serine/threonine protein kinase
MAEHEPPFLPQPSSPSELFTDASSASRPSGPDLPPAAPRFAPGEVLAGRYQVLRFLARGGMGEVYEVEDLELQVKVALKTVRPEPRATSSS